MELGAFSVSLTVQDLTRSRSFYEALGFTVFGGQASQGWLIMKNGTTVLGLFQGMFEKNLMTFNPGWDSDAQQTPGPFTDVRQIQRQLAAQGIAVGALLEEGSQGPGSFMIEDPDGNPILFDQHV